MKTKRIILLSLIVLLLPALIPIGTTQAANQQLVVDLSANTGPIKYGASGFLYGLGSEGVPTDNVLAPLNPQAIAQKAPDGAQHPNGDALKIAPQFARNGGKEIQIYMQDIYEKWPYENLGLADYLNKIDMMVPKVVSHPNRSLFVYVPFNEPDDIWYNGITNYSGSTGTAARNRFFSDWKTVFDRIRQLDPQAKIAGPNLMRYHEQFYSDFMSYAKANNVVPDIVTWHELQNDFFTDWYNHFNHYRNIETNLSITPRPIAINEYGRFSGDLGVPGNLVQWMARFENSKVNGMLAYWTTAGTLNDLITQNNKATGGWWLYKWYGELTGHTVSVTPPTTNGSLQGLAALDSSKKQARVIFGGSLGASDVFATDVIVKGFDSAAYFDNSVHVSVWGIDNTGTNPSTGPYLLQEGDYNVTNGQITVPVTGMKALSAYQLIVTPNKGWSPVNNPNRYEAEYAKLEGTAKVTYGSGSGYSGTYFVEGYGGSSNASTNFVITAPDNGYYNLTVRYAAGQLGSAPSTRKLRMHLNGLNLTDLTLPSTGDWNTWNSVTVKVFLTAGINRVDLKAFTSDDSDAVNIDYLEVMATGDSLATYEAESASNTLGGTAVITNDSAASGGKYVGYIGAGSGNTLQFNNINVPVSGLYRMVVRYANAEVVGDHSYNNNVVDRMAAISVNGQAASNYYFANTRKWNTYYTSVFDVHLNAGSNTIKFSNSDAYAPNIDFIQIAPAISLGGQTAVN